MDIDSFGLIMIFGSVLCTTKKSGWKEMIGKSRNQTEGVMVDAWLKGHIEIDELLGMMDSKYLKTSPNTDEA